MLRINRFENNPLLSPNPAHIWESTGAFNGCVVKTDAYHMLYRAQSGEVQHEKGHSLRISTIGYSRSEDGVSYAPGKQLLAPTESWETYGCEDPRVTYLDETYIICYTALSTFPFSASGIKVAIALSDDLQTISERHLATPFNAKAMGVFPRRVRDKITAIVSVDTDNPPSKIAIAQTDTLQSLWSEDFWNPWYASIDDHRLDLPVQHGDHIEVGAPPVWTPKGWLLIYSYIRNYFSEHKIFGIDAVLLDLDTPTNIIGHIPFPLLTPTATYERYGDIPNIVFPTGAIAQNDRLTLFYGGADTVTCAAWLELKDVFPLMRSKKFHLTNTSFPVNRNNNNPIISPNSSSHWQTRATFNPAVLSIKNETHILYRAIGKYKTSVIGHGVRKSSNETVIVSEDPIYEPRMPFEQKKKPGYSGCEDPRTTMIDDTIYMTYNVHSGAGIPMTAISTISLNDFLQKDWNNWSEPILISRNDTESKHAALFDAKFENKLVFLHTLDRAIWIDTTRSLDDMRTSALNGHMLMAPRTDSWDDALVFVGPPPISTDFGWIVFYNGLSSKDNVHRIGVALLDHKNPELLICRSANPILEPEKHYETHGRQHHAVVATGAVVSGDSIELFYGAGDETVASATIAISDIRESFM